LIARRPILRLALAAALAVALTACGEKTESAEPTAAPDRVELMLDFFPNGDHAPIYAAQANDRFEAAGLDVEIRAPADPAAPIRQVAAGRVDLAISYQPQVLRARDQGEPVVSVAAFVQRPLTSIVSLPRGGVRSPRDLEGKTVGTAGIDYQSAFLRTILTRAGVDPRTVEERNVGFGLSPALIEGNVDAVLGAFWNYEGTQLRQDDRRPRIIRVEDAGVPAYDELVIVANEDRLEDDPELVRRFLAALGRGTRDLERDPGAALDALLGANPELDRELQREVIDVTRPLFQPPDDRPYGYHDPAQWERFAAWMGDNGLLAEEPDPGAAFTNELLPGSGP
jgi:putative hydroxymethylpyrimidine transport system substrate-binding protein